MTYLFIEGTKKRNLGHRHSWTVFQNQNTLLPVQHVTEFYPCVCLTLVRLSNEHSGHRKQHVKSMFWCFYYQKYLHIYIFVSSHILME